MLKRRVFLLTFGAPLSVLAHGDIYPDIGGNAFLPVAELPRRSPMILDLSA